MQEQKSTIYQRLLSPTPDLIEQLLSPQGQAMLDRQILKMRDEIGEEEFNQYAEDFFKDTNIDYKQFFHIQPVKPQSPEESQQLKDVGNEPEQIKEDPLPQSTHQQQPFLTVIEDAPEDHTNNSQESDGFEEVEKTDLGNNSFKIKYKNGDQYEGQMQDGIKNGWGVYSYQSGQKYSGCFIDDEINGYGRYYFISGAQYEGDWSSGMKHGIGILKFANKDVYEGEFVKDEFHGKGKYRYHNGDIFQGNFYKGKRQGQGNFNGADGRLQIGEWIQDQFSV